MTNLFLFGTLMDDALRAIVTGGRFDGTEAFLTDHCVRRAADGDFPVLAAGGSASGLLLRDLPEGVLKRLHFYEQGFGYVVDHCEVETPEGRTQAMVYRPGTPAAPSDDEWSLADWQRDWAAMTRFAAQEAMALFGKLDGEELRGAMPMIRVRADGRVRAAACPAPVSLRHRHTRDDVQVINARRPYTNYFALAETDLTHTRFDGGRSEVLNRAGLISGDAVTVLPYDPVRDRVLLVEQFRYGPFMRGDPMPWSLEPVAGRIDPGESPEACARRETVEEAGLTLHRLLHVANSYPSPGAVSEYLFSYVGLCDLPDLSEGRGGLDSEGEDIRTHVISFATLMDLVDSGEADDTPLLMTVFWLQRQRERGAFAPA
ncbi:NUDIX domain-containing protein [Oceaniglobus indicus]|uniref:NUDIX domain-containing protein n=1 Tax=Oceaniglobus indicus TaxID=2047749 RepID=UPI000C184226|nr:NUDIX domain-containing protein [Oceaniglobus indicus]